MIIIKYRSFLLVFLKRKCYYVSYIGRVNGTQLERAYIMEFDVLLKELNTDRESIDHMLSVGLMGFTDTEANNINARDLDYDLQEVREFFETQFRSAAELMKELEISKARLSRLRQKGLSHVSIGERKKYFNVEYVKGFIDKTNKAISDLSVGQVLDNDELTKIFKCGTQGGMRRSHITNTLVLITTRCQEGERDNVYEDVWKGDTLYYTGMGLDGDQSLDFAQNKTLRDSKGAIDVHLFEVLEPKKYTYAGEVELVGDPIESKQIGKDTSERKVYLFPLKLKNELYAVDEKLFKSIEEKKAQKAHELNYEQLLKMIERSNKMTSTRVVKSEAVVRNPYVADAAKLRAKGKCEKCGKDDMFEVRKNVKYLEIHHLIPLSEGGADTLDNVCALCANCHRELHYSKDRVEISEVLMEALERGKKI